MHRLELARPDSQRAKCVEYDGNVDGFLNQCALGGRQKAAATMPMTDSPIPATTLSSAIRRAPWAVSTPVPSLSTQSTSRTTSAASAEAAAPRARPWPRRCRRRRGRERRSSHRRPSSPGRACAPKGQAALLIGGESGANAVKPKTDGNALRNLLPISGGQENALDPLSAQSRQHVRRASDKHGNLRLRNQAKRYLRVRKIPTRWG